MSDLTSIVANKMDRQKMFDLIDRITKVANALLDDLQEVEDAENYTYTFYDSEDLPNELGKALDTWTEYVAETLRS